MDAIPFRRLVAFRFGVASGENEHLADTGDERRIPVSCRRPELHECAAPDVIARRIFDAVPIEIPIAEEAALENHAAAIVVRVAGAEGVFVASIRRGRRERRAAPGIGGEVVEACFFLSPREAAVVAAPADDQDLVVAEQRGVRRQEVARRRTPQRPAPERRVFGRVRHAEEAA